ncbi:MAG: peptidylprolyl isomerase [Acidobacteria bacterium]|nr:peptidylprolyl isomerase [Acidobacteriota bacterium]
MKKVFFPALLFSFLTIAINAQGLPPTTVPSRKPTLKRDRTLSVLLPKIIQYEDERTPNPELLDMVSPLSGYGGVVRKRAILALGRIGYPLGITALLDVLKTDRNPELRALAAFSIGEIESHYAVAALMERLDSETEKSLLVRARAVEALGKIASNKVSAEALGRYGLTGIAETLAKLLPDVTKPVTEENQLVTSLTLTALLRLRQPSTVPAIANQLHSPNADIRWQAANALARIRENSGAAVPALLPLLDNKEPLVRANAARALGVAKDAQAIAPLVKLLNDQDERVVASVINALGTIGDAKAVPPLLDTGNKLLAGYRAFDRTKLGVPSQQNLLLLVATACGNLKDAHALPFLKAFRLVDNRVGASPEVEIALAKFGEAAFFDFPDSAKPVKEDWKTIANFAQGLGQLNTEKAQASLIDLFAMKPDARAISDILNAMAATKLEGLQKILLAEIKAEDVIVRATVATLLGEAGDQSDAVINALNDAYKVAKSDKLNDARIAIVEAAAKLKHPLNVQVLAEESKDEDYVVRRLAAELQREAPQDAKGAKLNIGAVKTNHSKDFWRRMAQFATAGKNPLAVFHTKKGVIRVELFAADAPLTVDNFCQLAQSGYFNGLAFIRVVPNFVIQGGDPRGDQNGGPGYQIRDEINLRPYTTGTLGMALSGKDTGGSQFFITHAPQPHLDGGYTVFGQVVEGMEVVNRIARGDIIERLEIIEPK